MWLRKQRTAVSVPGELERECNPCSSRNGDTCCGEFGR